MTRRSHAIADERGETLLEVLVATSILGVAVVALVGGIGSSIVVSDIHRKEATAQVVIHTYAESIERAIAATTTPYTSCPTLSTYGSPAGFSVPSGYAASVAAVTYWDGTSSFVSSCSPDIGIQKLTLSVRSSDARATETLTLVVRKPCLTASACS